MSQRYVYHNGSGTYIALDECVVMEVTDEVDNALANGDADAGDCEVLHEASLGYIVSEYLNQHDWPTFPDDDDSDGAGC